MAVYMSLKPGMLDWMQERVDLQQLDDPKWKKARDFLLGNQRLTVSQVRELSKRTNIPFGYFFLEEPPQETLPILQYRTIENDSVRHPSRNLIDSVSFARNIQSCVREARENQENSTLKYVGSERHNARSFCVEETAKTVRAALQLRPEWNMRLQDAASAIRRLRKAAQHIDITVMLDPLVRHDNNRRLDVEEFRAFCFADELAPLVFINSNDTPGAQLFSLLHEIIHIFVGRDDFFNNSDDSTLLRNVRSEEAFCNAVTGELLAPREIFVPAWMNLAGSLEKRLRELAETFNSTVPAMLYRALTYGLLTREESAAFIQQWRSNHAAAPLLPAAEEDGGPSGNPGFYNPRISRIGGAPVISAIVDGVQEGRISYMDAFRLTGTTLKTFRTMVWKATGNRWAP